ncbi:MAG TPA: hypothetical protein VGE16_01110 [Albitalea sp.]
MDAPLPNFLIAALALGIALALRPWRCVGEQGPPTPWLLAWAVMPLLWGLDRFADVPSLPSVSGVALLVLLAGWPLAVLSLFPVALVMLLCTDLGAAQTLHRLVWLGIVPATLLLGVGAALRRWLPNQVFVYILGRGFFGTLFATVAASFAALALSGSAAGSDAFVARGLLAFGEAFITGGLAASLVAFRPQLLATYADRLYLGAPAPRGP